MSILRSCACEQGVLCVFTLTKLWFVSINGSTRYCLLKYFVPWYCFTQRRQSLMNRILLFVEILLSVCFFLSPSPNFYCLLKYFRSIQITSTLYKKVTSCRKMMSIISDENFLQIKGAGSNLGEVIIFFCLLFFSLMLTTC